MSLPALFLEYQQAPWRELAAHPVVVIEKSRRTGFSWAAAAIAVDYCARGRAEGGMDALYMGYDKEMAREFISYVGEWAKVFQAGASTAEEFVFEDPEHPEKSVGAFRVRFASGYEVIALPSVARALRGKQGLVILDEAAFMDKLGDVLKAAFALLIWGGKVLVVSTHDGAENPFNELVQDIRAGRLPYRLLRTTFDDALEQGLYARICLKSGQPWTAEGEVAWKAEILRIYGDNADEELNVIPNPISGTWLSAALLEARASNSSVVARWKSPEGFVMWPAHLREATVKEWCEERLLPVLKGLDPDELHCFGMDFARVRDASVIWVLATAKTLVRRTPLVVELRDVPHEQQAQILFYVCSRLPRFIGGKVDAGGNGSYIGEKAMQEYGESVEPLQLSEPWYRENMPPLKAAIEDAMITLPADRDVIGDFRQVKLVRGVARVPDRVRGDDKLQRHGDAAIAATLAYAASRTDYEEFAYEALRRERPDPRAWRETDDEDDVAPAPGGGIMPNWRGALA